MSAAPSPEEGEAILLVWESRGHSRTDPIPDDEAASILAEIRERMAAIERQAFTRLTKATSESRRSPRRHQRLAFGVLLACGAILGIVAWLAR